MKIVLTITALIFSLSLLTVQPASAANHYRFPDDFRPNAVGNMEISCDEGNTIGKRHEGPGHWWQIFAIHVNSGDVLYDVTHVDDEERFFVKEKGSFRLLEFAHNVFDELVRVQAPNLYRWRLGLENDCIVTEY